MEQGRIAREPLTSIVVGEDHHGLARQSQPIRRAQDVSDPIGAGIEEYSRCREEIVGHLSHLLDEMHFADE